MSFSALGVMPNLQGRSLLLWINKWHFFLCTVLCDVPTEGAIKMEVCIALHWIHDYTCRILIAAFHFPVSTGFTGDFAFDRKRHKYLPKILWKAYLHACYWGFSKTYECLRWHSICHMTGQPWVTSPGTGASPIGKGHWDTKPSKQSDSSFCRVEGSW